MGGLLKIRAILVAVVLATAGGAVAQESSIRGAGTGHVGIPGLTDIDAISAAPKGVRQDAGSTVIAKPLVASPEATALEKAQNTLRTREGRLPLAWSATLAAEAEAGAVKATEGVCTLTSTLKAQAPGSTNVYWSAATRRMDGASTAQNLLPSFVVSEWRLGKADYDPATGKCRQPGAACETYVRMMSAESRAVGCAVKTCPSQTQVYVCRYGK